MASSYITPEISVEPSELAQQAYDELETQIPGWEPTAGDLVAIVIEALSRIIAERMEVDALVPDAIFRTFGATLASLPPIDAEQATGDSTWTVINDDGYTIPEGTQVTIAATGDDLIGFEVAADVTIAPGDTATATGEVQLVAIDAGVEGNDLTADPELVDTIEYVTAIELDGTTSGGVDAEEDSTYLDRLSLRLELLADTPILPRDFAIIAEDHPSVDRAVAIDGYNPVGGTFNNERMVHVVVVDEDGAALGSGVKNEVDADLEARREVNFLVTVGDPTSNAIDVTVAGVALPGFDVTAVEAAVEGALADYLDPANWGRVTEGDPGTGSGDWLNVDKVRYLEVAEVVNRVEGFHYITSLSVEGGTADVTLTGVAPLTAPGTIAATVVAPS